MTIQNRNKKEGKVSMVENRNIFYMLSFILESCLVVALVSMIFFSIPQKSGESKSHLKRAIKNSGLDVALSAAIKEESVMKKSGIDGAMMVLPALSNCISCLTGTKYAINLSNDIEQLCFCRFLCFICEKFKEDKGGSIKNVMCGAYDKDAHSETVEWQKNFANSSASEKSKKDAEELTKNYGTIIKKIFFRNSLEGFLESLIHLAI